MARGLGQQFADRAQRPAVAGQLPVQGGVAGRQGRQVATQAAPLPDSR